jgi:hypothetical protein
MAWYSLADLEAAEDNEETPLQRAARVKRYAQKVLALYESGAYDPERTAIARARGQGVIRQLDGLAREEYDAFTPAQRAQLRALSKRLRAYARGLIPAHTHGRVGAPGRLRSHGGGVGGRSPRGAQIARMTALPISGWSNDSEDDELGFLPAIGGIISAALPLVSNLLGGGESKAATPAPAPAAAPPVIVPTGATQAGAGAVGGNVSLPAIGGVVADQIRAVPANVRQQVVDSVRDTLDRYQQGQASMRDLVENIQKNLGPSLQKQMQELSTAQLQRQATFEHESLKARDARWKSNQKAQQEILNRINVLGSTLTAALQREQRRSRALGRAYGIPVSQL